jgi:predicted amidohydrolase
MHEKIIAAIALNNKDYPSFAAKLEEAVRWTTFAAKQGADLVVLPETLNLYAGDGDPEAMSMQKAALDDWQSQTRVLFDCARRNSVALTIPLVIRENGSLVNCFFVIARDGSILGRYEKKCPTPSELKEGVRRGQGGLIEWEGIRLGGAICFDCYFPEVFTQQADAGAQLFLIPSLTPGGSYLTHYAMSLGVPIALAYPAYSRIIDLDGRELAGGGYRHETLRFGFGSPVVLAQLNFERAVFYAHHNQEKIVAIQEAYGSAVSVSFNQENCLFVIASQSNDLKINDIIQRFDLIRQRDFFRDSMNMLCQAHG